MRWLPFRNSPLALALLVGCTSSGPTAPRVDAKSPWAFEKTFNEGTPVTLTLRLDRVEVSLSERVTLEQELRVDDGFVAEFPEYLPEDFEGFSVVEIATPRSEGGMAPGNAAAPSTAAVKVLTKRLTLEPDRSGTLMVAPLAVYFHRSGEKSEQLFLTEEVPVTVKAIDNVKDLTLEPLVGIYESPPLAQDSRAGLYVGIAAVALSTLGAAYLLLRRKKRSVPLPAPPHELAYEALRRLVALGLIEKGEIELFFVHLSHILREYIERRFEVKAPERTTEEFLDESSHHPALASHKSRLREFLVLCDQVKFARFEPDAKTIQGAFDVVKQFLAETTATEVKVA